MIPKDCIPEPGCRVIEITSKPDKDGAQSFVIYWMGYNPSTNSEGYRGQHFHAKLFEHMALCDRIVDRTKQ